MPRLFALDHNFPQPIVAVLSEYQADAEMVRVDQIDARLPDLDDLMWSPAISADERMPPSNTNAIVSSHGPWGGIQSTRRSGPISTPSRSSSRSSDRGVDRRLVGLRHAYPAFGQ
jgi:hypothetical protein